MALLDFGGFQLTLQDKYETALMMLADWVLSVDKNGTGWDDWDEAYKDAAYRPCPIREDLDKTIEERKEIF